MEKACVRIMSKKNGFQKLDAIDDIVNDTFITYCQKIMEVKNYTYRTLAQKIKCSEKTIFSYFTTKSRRKIPYSMAVVLFIVLMQGKEFISVGERKLFQNKVEHEFYFAFRSAFDSAGGKYLCIEKKYGISHSTAYCYYNERKSPLLSSAYKASYLLHFELLVPIEIIKQSPITNDDVPFLYNI